ncbi:MAG: OmpA family protein, partial [Planctomycetaceae bacterium]
LRKLVEKYPGLLEFNPANGMVKFKADMTFTPGSDIVNDKAKQALAEFVKILNMPEAQPFHIYIAGHTDDMPISKPETKRIHPNNWYLSVHRAVAVEEVMEGAGLAPVRAGAMGFGEHHPVADNAPGRKGNELNRRVEVWIVPQERFLTTDGATIAPAPMPKATTPKVEKPAPAVPAVIGD